MNFALDEDQALFLDALEPIATAPGTDFVTGTDWGRFDWSETLDRDLEQNGYLDVAAEPSLGCLAAVAMVYRLAQRPVTAEYGASALLRPFLPDALPRPLAICAGDGGAIRFLPQARAIVRLNPEAVHWAPLDAAAVEPVESLFAYPMGRLRADPAWQALDCDATGAATRWRLALAAELAGTLRGGLDAVLDHVRNRRQFGRPLGSFQGVQHRLATASVGIEGAHWLVMKAAQSLDPGEAALALGRCQSISAPVCYDLHQFMGAMGLTLEHPLHRWTYRARALRSAMGGAAGNLALAARLRWGGA